MRPPRIRMVGAWAASVMQSPPFSRSYHCMRQAPQECASALPLACDVLAAMIFFERQDGDGHDTQKWNRCTGLSGARSCNGAGAELSEPADIVCGAVRAGR